jgi:predicted nucleotidyltransferase
VLSLIHRASGLPVDLVVAGPGLEDEFLAQRRHVDIGGVTVPVISPEDLIVTKILAGRPKDLDDARGVLREQGGRLDIERSLRFLRLLEQALGRSDLVRVLDQLLET